MISPDIIDEFVDALKSDSTAVMATGCAKIEDREMLENPNVVKVVTDLKGNALLFRGHSSHIQDIRKNFAAYEHIGIYVYRKDFLMKYITLEPTPLSATESLEQMKVLEHGYGIKVVKTRYIYDALSVDTQEDLEKVEAIMKAKQGG